MTNQQNVMVKIIKLKQILKRLSSNKGKKGDIK